MRIPKGRDSSNQSREMGPACFACVPTSCDAVMVIGHWPESGSFAGLFLNINQLGKYHRRPVFFFNHQIHAHFMLELFWWPI